MTVYYSDILVWPNRQTIKELGSFRENVHPPPCVRCHVLCVTCQVSHVKCPVPVVTIFLDNVMDLVLGGSVINGAYPVLFYLDCEPLGGISLYTT